MKRLLIILFIGFWAGCSVPVHTIKYDLREHASKPPWYDMKIFYSPNLGREYKVIGQVRDTAESVFESSQEVVNNLKQAAKKMGGDALINLQTETIVTYDVWNNPSNETIYKARVIIFIEQD